MAELAWRRRVEVVTPNHFTIWLGGSAPELWRAPRFMRVPCRSQVRLPDARRAGERDEPHARVFGDAVARDLPTSGLLVN